LGFEQLGKVHVAKEAHLAHRTRDGDSGTPKRDVREKAAAPEAPAWRISEVTSYSSEFITSEDSLHLRIKDSDYNTEEPADENPPLHGSIVRRGEEENVLLKPY
jgi:hypothetical protein